MTETAHPLAPVDLPEFGVEISWAMCRNPRCENFGIHYAGPAPTGEGDTVQDERYRITSKDGRIRCKYCGQSFTLKSNRAIRPLARHFLSLSLPFGDCPNTDCGNHGRNAFEHFFDRLDLRVSRYHQAGPHSMICRSCGRTFSLGTALGLSKNDTVRASLREIIDAVRTTRGIADTIEATRITGSAYYGRLRRCAARLRDYHAWRNARLLHRDFARKDEPIRVYTDTVHVSFRRLGDAERVQNLELVTSVVELERTWYILAAHAGFLPKELCPDEDTQTGEFHTPVWRAAWDCVRHPYRVDLSASVKDIKKGLPNIGRHGFFTVPYYTELAHFLVVRKMLSRFRSVHHVMDGSTALYSAALTAMAKDVRDRRVELVLFQHDEEGNAGETAGVPAGGSIRDEETLKARLDSAWKEMEVRLDEQIEESQPELLDDSNGRRKVARLFKSAFRGAYSNVGRWAWLTFPPDGRQYHKARVLWLTWMPGKSYEDTGRELLWRSTLYPVDSAANFLRQRVRSFQRPVARAQPGRGYLHNYLEPRIAQAELWIVLLWRNFGLRVRTTTPVPPAEGMRLAKPSQAQPDLLHEAWTFRLGATCADRMSRWLRQ